MFSLTLSNDWNIEFHPLPPDHHYVNGATEEGIVLASIDLATLYSHDGDARRAFAAALDEDGGISNNENATNQANAVKAAHVALADYTARALSDLLPVHDDDANGSCRTVIQTMAQSSKHDASTNNTRQGRQRRMRRKTRKEAPIPYVLERTDCMVSQPHSASGEAAATLQFFLHATNSIAMEKELEHTLGPTLNELKRRLTSSDCFAHVASVVLQRQMRAMLQPPKTKTNPPAATNDNGGNGEKKSTDSQCSTAGSAEKQQYLNAVAFIADGSLLPRKSGRSMSPMSSPPAVPFVSPRSEQLTRTVTVDVGHFWRRFLNDDGSVATTGKDGSAMDTNNASEDTRDSASTSSHPATAATTVTMRGMIIPRGVTLIVGGGYHGKSTLLQAICMGIYDALPSDGRERVVTHADAVAVRAEDGRYVHNVNVSAFISNLPRLASSEGEENGNAGKTVRFGTEDASGSTSQAANVIEAVESGATALLVDEDVSAANFMARDGRMRAMISDEPITPLLYRVNGLFLSTHAISTVVVVGGVGEWLDVADAVVLMKDYVAYDGLEKAKSVSYQFSYSHIQYAGRGVVHRLPWKKEASTNASMEDENTTETLSPLRRRPGAKCVKIFFQHAAVHLFGNGSSHIWLYPDNIDDEGGDMVCEDNTNNEDDGMVDMTKCSQLIVGNASEQLYGCGICILWIIQESQRHPECDLSELLDQMEHVLSCGSSNNNGSGMHALMLSLNRSMATANIPIGSDMRLPKLLSSHNIRTLWKVVGFAYRPRRHEVAMALTRVRGMKFDGLPKKPKLTEMASPEEEMKCIEDESRKRALAELWANRRRSQR